MAEAVQVGLIDESAQPGEVFDRATQTAKAYLKVPDFARSASKIQVTRRKHIEWFDGNRGRDLDNFLNLMSDEKVQQSFDMYMAMMQKKTG